MVLNKRAALGGTQLDGLDTAIVIRSIDPGTPKETVGTAAMMGGSGSRITNKHWDMLEATVAFAIDLPKKQLAARKAVFDKVIAWAAGKGWLTINWMPGKRLWVDNVVLPSAGDIWNWTDEFTITFRAYAVPFWQDATSTTVSIASGDSGSGSITVPGMLETVCDAEITNAGSADIDTLSVTIGGSSFSFTDLGLEGGETLKIIHNEDGLLSIRIYSGDYYSREAMGMRTGSSSDDLYVLPGSRTITITGGTVTASVKCFGRYIG